MTDFGLHTGYRISSFQELYLLRGGAEDISINFIPFHANFGDCLRFFKSVWLLYIFFKKNLLFKSYIQKSIRIKFGSSNIILGRTQNAELLIDCCFLTQVLNVTEILGMFSKNKFNITKGAQELVEYTVKHFI